MKYLKEISTSELLDTTEKLVIQERRISTEILHHLAEIEYRKAYAEKYDCRSLFEYATQVLKYTEGSAHRRIQAMYALKKNPELEAKIQSGALNVTSVARIETFVRREEKQSGVKVEPAVKEALYRQAENVSQNTLEMKLAEMSPRAAVRETVRPVLPDLHELKTYLTTESLQKFTELQGWLAYSLKDEGSSSEVLARIIDTAHEVVQQQKSCALKRTAKGRKAQATSAEVISEDPPLHKMEVEPPTSRAHDSVARSKSGPLVVALHGKTGAALDTTPVALSQNIAPQMTWESESSRNASPSMEEIPARKRAEDSTPDTLIGQPTHHSRYVPRPLKHHAYTRADCRCEHIDPHTGQRCNSTHRLDIHHLIPYARGGSSTDAENHRVYCASPLLSG